MGRQPRLHRLGPSRGKQNNIQTARTMPVRKRHEHAKDDIGMEQADAPGATLSLEWLYALLGLAPSTHGMLTDDSASANFLGLACARYRMLNGHAEGVVYCSER